MSEDQRRTLTEIADGVPPRDMRDEKMRVALKRQGFAFRDDGPPWRWHLTDAGRAALGRVQ